jgi:hypothetical protein
MSYLVLLTTLVMALSASMIAIAGIHLLLGDRRMIRGDLTLIKYFAPVFLISLITLTLAL